MAKEYVMSRELKAQQEEIEKVEHPKHYNRDGAMECIDEMVLIFGKEAVKNFCICNAWKYRYRAADKNGEEDLRKSDWYLNKFKELSNNEPKSITTTTDTPTITLPYKGWEEPQWWRNPVIYCNDASGVGTVAQVKTN